MNDNIYFLNHSNYKFRVDSIGIDWTKRIGQETYEQKQIAFLCLHDTESKIDIVHKFTDFIFTYWKFSSYNTQRKHALNLATFLNFLLEHREQLKINSIMDLEIHHAEKYLNFLTKLEKARETVKDKERTISKFFYYLSNKEMLSNIPKNLFVSYTNTVGKDIFISPFKNIIYPNYSPRDTEHSFPIKYLPLLFEIACIEAKPIALGLYLQIFGGLRVGEIVNVSRNSIRQTLKGNAVLINLKENMFRTDIKDTNGGNYVKNPRKQQVFILENWFFSLYKDHLKLFSCKDGTGALFVNRNGKALSASSYRQYFEKVKRYFLYILKNNGKIEDKILAHHLSTSSWSTHIGRGIFSNMLAEYAENPYEIAVPRGDHSLLSSLTYLKHTTRLKNKLEERLNHMQGNYIPRLVDNINKSEKQV